MLIILGKSLPPSIISIQVYLPSMTLSVNTDILRTTTVADIWSVTSNNAAQSLYLVLEYYKSGKADEI